MVGCLEESSGGSSIRLGKCVIRSNSDGCPDNWVRNALNEEHRSWLPLRERRVPGPCPRPQQTGAQDQPRVKRRVQYAWVQQEYNENRSRRYLVG